VSGPTHVICYDCWYRDGRAERLVDRPPDPETLRPSLRPVRSVWPGWPSEWPSERCCYCGAASEAGLYVERGPRPPACGGVHGGNNGGGTPKKGAR